MSYTLYIFKRSPDLNFNVTFHVCFKWWIKRKKINSVLVKLRPSSHVWSKDDQVACSIPHLFPTVVFPFVSLMLLLLFSHCVAFDSL